MFDAVALSYRSAGQLSAEKGPVAADAVEISTWNKDNKMKILLASSIDPGAISELEKYHEVVRAFGAGEEELLEKMPGTEILVFRSGVQINARVLEAGAPDLRLLLRAGSGTDNIDLDYVAEHGLRLERIPGPGAKAVAELAFSLMLGLARNVHRADRLLRDGVWAKSELTGFLLTGKTLGVVGAGNIGTRVGELGTAWGMNVIGCVGAPGTGDEVSLAAKGIQLKSFTEVLSQADFVSVHVPLQESTRNLLDAEAIGCMKEGAYLVNLARGGVADEVAVHAALVSGQLAGAGFDVHAKEGANFNSPLAGLDNVILTPHIGAATHDSQREIGEIICDFVASYTSLGKVGSP
jgi:D-3-phosphoglycerate dehydrogenase